MIIKEVKARIVLDSRNEKTIQVIIKTKLGKFKTSAPSGKSTGKYEAKPYYKSLEQDIDFINKLDKEKLVIEKFEDLKKVERFINGKIGANTLFSLEASLLKAAAKENKKELWNFLNPNAKKIPKAIGNAIGGGVHSKDKEIKKPDFQEFLFIADGISFKECVKLNEIAYKIIKRKLSANKRNDECAWKSTRTNEEILETMEDVRETIKDKYKKKIDIGIDIASSSFFNKTYNYKNPKKELNKKEQINYIKLLVEKSNLLYVEDPLEENDFNGFSELKKKTNCLIVGDDLTVTNPIRFKKAIKLKSINAIIVKPNQVGSLLKVKEIIHLAKKHNIKTIISHRSGETKDDTIADLGVAWNCDFIKTGIYGKVRKAKLKRIIKIEKRLRR
jgi:enolase